MEIEKTNEQWANCLTLWWGNLKTANYMLDMQNNVAGITLPYDQYQHLFPGVAFWYL